MPTDSSSVLPIAIRSPEWPSRGLDVADLRAGGLAPVPFRDLVLKVHQRCNLACDYCYVYEMADQSWRTRPRVMEEPVWRAAADRMAAHARTHRLDRMRLVLHGGEPLLAGLDRLVPMIAGFRAAFDGVATLRVQMQTNGLLLDAATLDALRAHRVEIGVSLDGVRADHDRRRRRADGRGSFDAVDRALRLLTADESGIFAGLLCTIDPATDPIATYEALLAYRPPTLDLLIPHANWDLPPAAAAPAYANWLISVFDRWYDAPEQEVGIRLFEDLLALILGGTSRSEQAGLSPVAVVVVETDGAIEQVDSLKSAYSGACDTGLNVFANPLDDALDHPGVVARQIGAAALGPACQACPERDVCGGGHYAHRYRSGHGFRNPTVYCADMLKLIGHIRGRVTADLERLGR